MADEKFEIQGSFGTVPLSGSPSGIPSVAAPLSAAFNSDAKSIGSYTILGDDDQIPVEFGGVTTGDAVILQAEKGPAIARITSGSNEDQIIQFELLVLTFGDVTAIKLSRQAGVQNTISVFLAQQA